MALPPEPAEPAELVADAAVDVPSPPPAHEGSPTEPATADVAAPIAHTDGALADGPELVANTGAGRTDGASAEPELGPLDVTESREELPILDAAALMHFASVQQALTPRESVLARAIATELSPAELRAWIADLRPLSIPEAVMRVRGALDQIERGGPVEVVP